MREFKPTFSILWFTNVQSEQNIFHVVGKIACRVVNAVHQISFKALLIILLGRA